MTPSQSQVIDSCMAAMAKKLGRSDGLGLVDRLDRSEVAKLAGFRNARALASSVARGQGRFANFRKIVGKGSHTVPAQKIALWLAIEAGALPADAAGEDRDGECETATTLDSAWHGDRRVVRCEG